MLMIEIILKSINSVKRAYNHFNRFMRSPHYFHLHISISEFVT